MTGSHARTVRHDALADVLAQLSFTVIAELSRLASEHDLSLTQLRVLAILRGRRLRIGELAAHLGLEKSTMSGLVDRAERRGLLQRTAHASDGRVVEIGLSSTGKALVERGHAAFRSSMTPMLEPLSAAERRTLQSLLARMLS